MADEVLKDMGNHHVQAKAVWYIDRSRLYHFWVQCNRRRRSCLFARRPFSGSSSTGLSERHRIRTYRNRNRPLTKPQKSPSPGPAPCSAP